jgi:hypothetical protein
MLRIGEGGGGGWGGFAIDALLAMRAFGKGVESGGYVFALERGKRVCSKLVVEALRVSLSVMLL